MPFILFLLSLLLNTLNILHNLSISGIIRHLPPLLTLLDLPLLPLPPLPKLHLPLLPTLSRGYRLITHKPLRQLRQPDKDITIIALPLYQPLLGQHHFLDLSLLTLK